MDFDDTPEEAEFRGEARAFLEKHMKLRGPDDAPSGVFERDDPDTIRAAQEWQGLKAGNGWACITWPKEFGGRGGTPIQSVIWNQEEGKFKTPPNIFLIGIGMLGPTIMHHGTPEQKDRYLAKMARGEEIWCQLFSEPGAGSDLAALQMSAVKDGNDWVLNGQKVWTTGAHYSQWGMLPARSDPNIAKHAGISYFIVDMAAPGIDIRPIKQINGAQHFTEVFFGDVRIPDSYRVGAEGNGWKVALTTLMHERAAVGGGGAGIRVEDLVQLARETELNGRPAIEDSSVRQRIADFVIDFAGLKNTGYRTLTALSRGQMPGPEASIMKLVGASLMQQVASFGLEILGPAGVIVDEEGGWQDAYLSASGMRLAGGSDEILMNIIAERVLGLPPEPRVDKGIAFRDIPTGPPS